MKLKKVLALTLAIAMVLGTMGTVAFAADTLPEAEGDVIVLTEDVILTSTLTISEDVTIDLNGHKITSPDITGDEKDFSPLIKISGATVVITDSADEKGAIVPGEKNDIKSYNNTVRTIEITDAADVTIKNAVIKGQHGVNTKFSGNAIETYLSTLKVVNSVIAGGDNEKRDIVDSNSTYYYNQGNAGKAIVSYGSNVVIAGSKISGGKGTATGNTVTEAYVDGGANYAYGASAIECRGKDGIESELKVTGSEIKCGDSDIYNAGDGALYLQGNTKAVITGSDIIGGQAKSPVKNILGMQNSGIPGEAFSLSGTPNVEIDGCTVVAGAGNSSTVTGALEISNSSANPTVVIKDSVIDGNETYAIGGSGKNGSFTLIDSTIKGEELIENNTISSIVVEGTLTVPEESVGKTLNVDVFTTTGAVIEGATTDGTTDVVVKTAVAEVNGAYYDDLAEAIAALSEGDTLAIATGAYDAFDVLVDDVTITGMDEDTVITINSIPNCAFIGIKANGVTVENLTFVVSEDCAAKAWYTSVLGYYSNHFNAGSAGITGYDVDNCKFINESSSVAIAIFNFDSFEVTNSTFENFGTGITSMSDGSAMGTVAITDNTFTKVNEPVNVYWGKSGSEDDGIIAITGNTFASAKDADEIKITVFDYASKEDGKSGIDSIDLSGNTFNAATEVEIVDAATDIAEDVKEELADEENVVVVEKYAAIARIGNDKYFKTIADAVAAAEVNDVIDLLGNVVDLPEVNSLKITKDLTIQNGTIDISNGVWNGNSIIEVYGGTANDFVTATFKNVDFVGDSYSSAFGVIYAHSNGKAVIDSCNFTLSNERYSAGGVLKGNVVGNSAFDVTNSTFDLENPNRIIANATVNLNGVKIDAVVTDDSLVVGDMNNHAFRNLVGTVKDSQISVDGFETGIKNTDGDLTISDNSLIVLTNSKDTDLVVGAGKKVTVSENSKLYADTTNIASDATVDGEGFIPKADVIHVQYKKVDLDANGEDNLEGADKYEIVLAGADAEKINELASADLTFDFEGTLLNGAAMDYAVEAAEGVSLTKLGDRYLFNYDGVTKYEESGAAIVIGTITIEGYGSYTLKTDEQAKNAVYATEIRDNIVDGYEDAATLVINAEIADDDDMVGKVEGAVIAVPVRDLAINIDFPNAVANQSKAYQEMKVVISGGDLKENIEIELGEDWAATGLEIAGKVDAGCTVNYANNAYAINVIKALTLNNAYTVTVSGAGYRTARYTVTMTEAKTLNFWNNVMDNNTAVEEGVFETTKNFLAGDIVKDNNINIYDLSAVVSYFGTETVVGAASDYAKYDLNRDGVIDSRDVAYVLVSWGE